MAKVTISMFAYNKGKYIADAITSILQQNYLDFKLVIVDDFSEDETGTIVKLFNDPRIELVQNDKHCGEAYCYNLVIKQSLSDFIIHVEPEAILLPEALQKTVDILQCQPEVAHTHSYYFFIDADAQIIRNDFRQQRKVLESKVTSTTDYKRAIITQGNVCSYLRAYRRRIFDDLGLFNESLSNDYVIYEMALRIVDRYSIKLVPEFLYATRAHEKSQSLLDKGKNFAVRLWICWQLSQQGQISFLKEKQYRSIKWFIIHFYRSSILAQLWLRIIIYYRRLNFSNLINFLYNCWLTVSSNPIYYWLINHFSQWEIRTIKKKLHNPEKRIAYILWHYPTLSETFIRREIAALQKAGMCVQVIADAPDNLEIMDKKVAELVNETYYLFPINSKRFIKHFVYFLVTKNLEFFNLFLYVVFHSYAYDKSLNMDCIIFAKAVAIAGVLKDKGINHIHSPWTNTHAFLALIASRLLDIPYSVQARANDIHRKRTLFGLSEKLNNAFFIITNTVYNKNYLSQLLGESKHNEIHQIYNGLDLIEFNPLSRDKPSKLFKILTVGRLVEQKGFEYLLKACHILKQQGVEFCCEIIGGIQESLDMNCYIRLKKLHQELELKQNVFFLQSQPLSKIIKYYQEADLFVLPCVITEKGDRDIIPNVLIEAMAMKLPVVATTVTGIPEMVDHEINGILVPPKDEKSLAEAILKLMGNEALRKKYGHYGRLKVEDRFDINKNIEKYVKLFKNA